MRTSSTAAAAAAATASAASASASSPPPHRCSPAMRCELLPIATGMTSGQCETHVFFGY